MRREGKKKVEHIGIKVQLFVRIEMYYEKTEHELSRVLTDFPCTMFLPRNLPSG